MPCHSPYSDGSYILILNTARIFSRLQSTHAAFRRVSPRTGRAGGKGQMAVRNAENSKFVNEILGNIFKVFFAWTGHRTWSRNLSLESRLFDCFHQPILHNITGKRFQSPPSVARNIASFNTDKWLPSQFPRSRHLHLHHFHRDGQSIKVHPPILHRTVLTIRHSISRSSRRSSILPQCVHEPVDVHPASS